MALSPEFDPRRFARYAIFTRDSPTSRPAGTDNNLYDTIYTAVNEGLYMQSNPYGFLGGQYTIGASLRSLGINIVNGQIPGVLGIYFATTPFTFDPTFGHRMGSARRQQRLAQHGRWFQRIRKMLLIARSRTT